MIKLPIDQKYQLSFNPFLNKYSNLTLQEALDITAPIVLPYLPPGIHFQGEPDNTITVKDKQIFKTLMTAAYPLIKGSFTGNGLIVVLQPLTCITSRYQNVLSS